MAEWNHDPSDITQSPAADIQYVAAGPRTLGAGEDALLYDCSLCLDQPLMSVEFNTGMCGPSDQRPHHIRHPSQLTILQAIYLYRG